MKKDHRLGLHYNKLKSFNLPGESNGNLEELCLV